MFPSAMRWTSMRTHMPQLTLLGCLGVLYSIVSFERGRADLHVRPLFKGDLAHVLPQCAQRSQARVGVVRVVVDEFLTGEVCGGTSPVFRNIMQGGDFRSCGANQ